MATTGEPNRAPRRQSRPVGGGGPRRDWFPSPDWLRSRPAAAPPRRSAPVPPIRPGRQSQPAPGPLSHPPAVSLGADPVTPALTPSPLVPSGAVNSGRRFWSAIWAPGGGATATRMSRPRGKVSCAGEVRWTHIARPRGGGPCGGRRDLFGLAPGAGDPDTRHHEPVERLGGGEGEAADRALGPRSLSDRRYWRLPPNTCGARRHFRAVGCAAPVAFRARPN